MHIIGLSKSGLSLIAGLLACSKTNVQVNSVFMFEYDTLGMSLLDKLNSDAVASKYIHVVRNPSTMICKYASEMNVTPKIAARLWFDVNTILWHFTKNREHFIVRIEDILLEERASKSIFNFAGVQYNPDYLRYGDFDQPDCLQGNTFNKGIIDIEEVDNYDKNKVDWGDIKLEYKDHPILKKLGYKIQGEN